jgi:hypothetical protein
LADTLCRSVDSRRRRRRWQPGSTCKKPYEQNRGSLTKRKYHHSLQNAIERRLYFTAKGDKNAGDRHHVNPIWRKREPLIPVVKTR